VLKLMKNGMLPFLAGTAQDRFQQYAVLRLRCTVTPD
jgi:hypothetical protein